MLENFKSFFYRMSIFKYMYIHVVIIICLARVVVILSLFKGTRCLGSGELVFEKRLQPIVMICKWLDR